MIAINNPYITHPVSASPWITIALGNTTGNAVIVSSTEINHTTQGGDVYPEIEDILFTYKQITGDFDISCQVPNVAAAWNIQDAGGGILCRQDLTTGDPILYAVRTWWADSVNRWAGHAYGYRTTKGGASAYAETAGRTDEHYMRLTRVGNVFTSYWDSNADAGSSWTQLGQQTLSSMPDPAYVGFFSSPLDPDFSEIDFVPIFQNITGI